MTDLDRRRAERGSALGNLITVLLLLGLIGLGVYLWLGQESARERQSPAADARTDAPGETAAAAGPAPEPIEPVDGTPVLEAAAPYAPRDGVVQIDISEYAGYGGLIVANGGLEPNPDSFFAREYGFQVRISMSESETWSPLNNGRLAATATTADVLAVLGRQFEAVVPVQIGYSRGADMVVVDRGIASVERPRGKGPRGVSVQRERVLHPLPRTGGRGAGRGAPRPRLPGAARPARPRLLRGRLRRLRRLRERARPGAPAASGLRRLDAPDRGGRRGLGRGREGARVEQEPAGRGRRPRR